MAIDLGGKPVAVTGASSGIGRAIALACATAGMPVGLFARRAEKLDTVRDEIVNAGGRAVCVVGSVDNAGDCQRLVDETERAFGPLFGAIANAGYGAERATLEMPEAEIRAMIETNFFGSMHTVRAAASGMRERDAGHLVLVSSCLAKIGVPHYAAYCASKAMQDHFARAMRHELAGDGVKVSSVHPVGTKTEFFDVAAAKSEGELGLFDRSSDRFMQPATRVARAVVKQLRRDRGGEVWTSLPTRTVLGLSVMLPGLTDRVLGRMYRKRLSGS